MKPIRKILVAAFLLAGIFSAVIYSACSKDRCNNVVCLNGGACNSGSCTCLAGYEGIRCATLSRDKFIFTFNGADTCSNNDLFVNQYHVGFLAIASNPVEMTMTNFLNNINDSAICTMQAPDSFTFIGSNNSTTYTGYGIMHNDSLWMNYHVQHDTISYNCAYKGGIYL